MLTRPQQILLKRAQAQAGIGDSEYRETLERLCHVRSSTDGRMTDEDLDKVMAYFEAIFWRGVDSGRLQPACKANAPFRQRGYWAAKNPSECTSRDRFALETLKEEIAGLESSLAGLGLGKSYCAAIKAKVMPNVTHDEWPTGLAKYRAALERTLASKAKAAGIDQPF